MPGKLIPFPGKVTFHNFVQLVAQERIEQNKKWGGPEHDQKHIRQDWIGFTMEKLQEMQYALDDDNIPEFNRVAIQVAALISATLESTTGK